jgi:hypothetical protein
MRGHRQRILRALAALSIAALTFVYRFNTLGGPLAGLDNDHFFQIVRAEAMLDGELSLRDYSDAELRSIWPQLTYATSAAAMRVMGRTLRSEALLDVGMLALGAAVLLWASADVAQSIAAAVIMTLLAVGLNPTLYNYPKIVPYAFAVIAFLAYARRPGPARLLAVAIVTVIATLYRHDHGIYLGIATAALIVAVHGSTAARPLSGYVGCVLIGLTPGLLFVQLHGGIVKYVRECLETSRHEVRRTAALPSSLRIDWSQPLLVRVPPPQAPRPRIAIRWAADVSPVDRSRAELDLGLADPQSRGDEHNWSYGIGDTSPRHVATIVNDPRVADTDGIDRRTFSLTAPPPPPPARGGVFGWRVAPGGLRESNADPWLRMIAWSVLFVALALLLWPPLRQRADRPEVPLAAIAAIWVMGALVCVVFLRNPGPFRLPDVSIPIAVLGSWLLTTIPRLARQHALPVRIGVSVLLVFALALSVLAVGVVGSVREQVAVTGIDQGASGITSRWRQLWDTLGALPDSQDGIDAGLAAAAGYLQRCTRPTDRLLVADYLPEVYYFARRRFAAGQVVFFGGFYTTQDEQREALDRWRRQVVPIALMQPVPRFESEFVSDYPLLAEYLRSRYHKVGTLTVERGAMVDVWIDGTQTRASDRETGFPCGAND